MASYDPRKVYEEAYSIKFNWEKWLPECVFRYHDLIKEEFNSPVELQMGILLPFISSCLGPQTSGLWTTEPGVLNLFWMNIAASGVGKSKARKKLIAEPLEYMATTLADPTFPDFEVSRFTRAGNVNNTYYIVNNFQMNASNNK